MKVYWTWQQIPELRDLPKHQRKRVLRACSGWNWKLNWKFMAIAMLLQAAIPFLAFWLASQGKTPTWTAVVLSWLGAGITGSIILQVGIERLRPSIREYLKEHGHI